jgi:hypothetical protein
MRQASRRVAAIEDVEIIEATREDSEGNLIDKSYYVEGRSHETLKLAMEAATRIGEG